MKTGNHKKAWLALVTAVIVLMVVLAALRSPSQGIRAPSQLAPSSGLTWPPVNGTVSEPAHPWLVAFVVQTSQGITFRNSLLKMYHNVDAEGVNEATEILREQYLGTNPGILAIQTITPLDRN